MGDRMIELQHQIRQNQSELRGYIDDLDQWTTDIKKKEMQLKKSSKSTVKEAPPIRNALQKKKKKKVIKEKPVDNKSSRIKGFDFKAWDKYDVEKALEEVDKAKSSSSEYETDEEWEEERRKEHAKVLKAEGNDHYKNARYAEAVDCYSRGVELDPCNPELRSNRAQALIKQECFAAAEQDCHAALELRPGFDKALFRRARARFELGKHKAARDDLRELLKFSPQNSEARKLLYKIEEEMRPAPEKRPGLVVPIYKSAEKRSQRPLRRVPLAESGLDDSAADAARQAQERARAAQSELTRATLSKEEQIFERITAPKQSVTETATSSQRTSNLKDVESKSHATEESTVEEELPPIPTTSYQLLQDWRKLKADAISFYCYFKRIAPGNYGRLLGEGLDADFLSYVVSMLLQHYRSDGESPLQCLAGLTKAKRFSFTVMFMGEKDKSALREIFLYYHNKSVGNASEIASQYGIKL